MVRVSPSIEQQKQFYNCKANDLGIVWCSYNEWKNPLHVYRRLLTNPLHGKAAELCLANNRNNSVTTTKYMSTLIAWHALLFLSIFIECTGDGKWARACQLAYMRTHFHIHKSYYNTGKQVRHLVYHRTLSKPLAIRKKYITDGK